MHTPATSSRSTGARARSLAALAALTVGLSVAFVVAPPRLAATGSAGDLADHGHLIAAFRAAVVEYWRSGDQSSPPALQRVVDYWVRFHLIKGGIAALLLIVLGTLTVLLWRMFLQSNALRAGSRAAPALAGAGVSLLTLSALAVVMANVQGALAPFSSLLPFMMGGPPDANLAAVLAQARRQLAGSHRGSGYTPPALDAMVGDFAWYHAVLAGIAVAVVVALLGLSAMSWRRLARADRRARPVWIWFGGLSAVSSLLVAVLLVANTGVARDPAPALLGLFNGGF